MVRRRRHGEERIDLDRPARHSVEHRPAAAGSAGRTGGGWRRARRGRAGGSRVRRSRQSSDNGSDALSRRRDEDDGGASGDRARQAGQAAEDPRPRQPARLRTLVDPAGREDDRGARQEDRRLDDDNHVRPGGHQRQEPRAVRRALPLEHDRAASSTRRRPSRRRARRKSRRARRRSSGSCAAARASPAFTRPATRITARAPNDAGAGAGRGGGGGRGGPANGRAARWPSVILRWSWGVNEKKLQANDLTLKKADMEAVSDADVRPARYGEDRQGVAGQFHDAHRSARHAGEPVRRHARAATPAVAPGRTGTT